MKSPALAILLVACGHPAQPVIPATTKQLVIAITDDWNSPRATLRLWTREGASWTPQGEPWPAVLGHAGSAWGIGLQPAREGPIKHEGDGKNPAGVFALRGTYGYASAPPAGSRLPYTMLDEHYTCVDDPASASYTRIVDRDHGDWHSAEHMRRSDGLYAWVIDVAHNPTAIPGAGSCIFLHVWRGPDSSTVGCTAMAESALVKLIAALDPADAPLFVLLPRAEYSVLAVPWGLPAP